MLRTLDEFMQLTRGHEYVREPGFKSLYVRIGSRYIDGHRYDKVLDLANATATKPGNGAFTALVRRLQEANVPLYAECILNDRMPAKLLSLGFTKVTPTGDRLGAPSFYWLPENCHGEEIDEATG